MFRLTIVQNPFGAASSRAIMDLPAGRTIRSVIDEHWAHGDYDLMVSKNGELLEDFDQEVKDGDSLIFLAKLKGGGGGPKNIIKAVALLAVVAVAAYVSGGAGALWFGLAPGSGMAITAGAAIGIGGSYLINAMMPPHVASLAGGIGGFNQGSNTYGWNPSENQMAEGLTIPAIYGVHRVTPQLISRHTTTDGESQYLNMLFAIAEGPVASISSVRINGNPIENYTGVSSEVRLGNLSATTIEAFNDTISETAVGGELTASSWVTASTSGNAVQGLGIGLVFPRGLLKVDSATGNFTNMSVTVRIEYQISPLGWHSQDFTITDNRAVTIRRFFNFTGLAAGPYEIRVMRLLAKTGLSTDIEDVHFEYFQERIPDDFRYPGTALLAIRALASDQLSGSRPVVDCLVNRGTVKAFPGSFPGDDVQSNNPAWVCYELLINTRYGAGVEIDRMIYADFLAWANFCDSHSLTCNIYFDAAMSVSDALAAVGVLGRGSVIQRGTDYGCWFDGSSSPVQLFTVGNILEDSLSISYLEKEGRSNICEISYYDAAIDYERKTIELRSDTYDGTTEAPRKISVNLVGCTSQEMAARHARFLLNCNRYLVRTVSFQAAVDAIACQPGDVVALQHDVPQWGYGGRVVSATSNTITLDRAVPVTTGQNLVIMVRLSATDALVTKTLVNPGTGNYSSFAIVGSWATIPALHDVYSTGVSGIHVMNFRVLAVERSQDIYCKITGLEYRAEIYNDAITIPVYPVASDLPPVAGLRLDDLYRPGPSGVIDAFISVTWRGFAVRWGVYYRELGASSWRKAGETTRPEFEISGVDVGKTYQVSVTTSDNPDEGVKATQVVIIDPPGAIIGLSGQTLDNFVTLTWQIAESELPLRHYEIRKGSVYATAQVIGFANKTFTTFFERLSGTYTYWVAAVDSRGQYGTPASVDVNLAVPRDFVLYNDQSSAFGGTFTHTVLAGGIFGPVDDAITWSDWWDLGPFSTWQSFLDAGFTSYIQPDGQTSGSYQETFDFGAIISAAVVSVELVREMIFGTTVAVNPVIETSADDMTWTVFSGVWQVSATNIRYARITLNLASNGQSATLITGLRVRATANEITESGSSTVTDAPSGKTISFAKAFADVATIQVTPIGTTAAIATYDFADIPNPTEFTVYLFDAAGNKTTGSFAYLVSGV